MAARRSVVGGESVWPKDKICKQQIRKPQNGGGGKVNRREFSPALMEVLLSPAFSLPSHLEHWL